MSSIQESRERLKTRIWQVLRGSNIAFSTAQREHLDTLVDQLADGMLVEFDALLDQMVAQEREQAAPPPKAPDPTPTKDPALSPFVPSTASATPSEEQILWQGRPFLSLVERYIVTTERVRIVTGLIGRAFEDIELIRVKDVDHSQSMGERMMGFGDIYLRSADPTRPNAVLRNVGDPSKVHEIIRRAMLTARKKYPTIFAQEV